jgi:hypothetical protein
MLHLQGLTYVDNSAKNYATRHKKRQAARQAVFLKNSFSAGNKAGRMQ